MARAAVKRGLRLSVGSWNTIWMRLRIGRLANFLAGIAPMSSPSNMMLPSVLSISRMIMVDVVDLPQPDSPTRPTLSPRSTVKLMPSTARKTSGSGGGPRREQLRARRHAVEPLRGYSLTSFSTTSSGSPVGGVPSLVTVARTARARPPRATDRASVTPGRGVARISLRV